MVFRNGDGTKEGKNASNGDYFINLAQGFQVTFTAPVASAVSLEVGESFEFKAETSSAATISFELDGLEVKKLLMRQY